MVYTNSISNSSIIDIGKTMQDTAFSAFGIPYLFPWQLLVISNILESDGRSTVLKKKSTETCNGKQIILLPTGSGKTVCFLVPALLLSGQTLVIYPLRALINDQRHRIENAHIPCTVLTGNQTRKERTLALERIKNKTVRLILATPEVLCNDYLLNEIKKCRISHIAIDEAHCVSEWGDTFRPAYLQLGAIIEKIKAPIITAFTATASQAVIKRITQVLFKGTTHIVRGPSDRENIHYNVRYSYAKKIELLRIVKTENKPMIIFCGTRRRTEDIGQLISFFPKYGPVRFYHAGMRTEEKIAVESWFMKSTDGILVATCAFGMGMNKKDIRTVVHLDSPNHLENFIQEAGRAGRDGKDALSILLWNHSDSSRYKKMKKENRERAIANYAESYSCRRSLILSYFDSPPVPCSGCDFCDANKKGYTITHRAKDAETVCTFIKHNNLIYTRKDIITPLTEFMNTRELAFFSEKVWDSDDCREILNQLFSERIITTSLWKNKITLAKKNYCTLFHKIPAKFIHQYRQIRYLYRSLQKLLHS